MSAASGRAGNGASRDAVVLLGNSRWHWAERAPGDGARAGAAGSAVSGAVDGVAGPAAPSQGPDGAPALRCFHTGAAPQPLPLPVDRWRAWAAVGAVPPALDLPPERRLTLAQVPLGGLPPWLGIDRALVGWGAWSRSAGSGSGRAVLVADAGTALSLTLVDGAGQFRGGRLAAGVAMQLRALAAGTALLPPVDPAWWQGPIPGPWPLESREAMVRGCLEAGAAAIAQAWRAACGPSRSGRSLGACQLWLTGGDGEVLAPLLADQGVPFTAAPNLALESLAALAWASRQAYRDYPDYPD